MPNVVALGLRAPPGSEKFGVFWLSVTLLNSEVCEREIAIKQFELATTSIWRLSDIQRFPMRRILN